MTCHHDGQYQIYNPGGWTAVLSKQDRLDGGAVLDSAASWPHIQGMVTPRA